MAVPNTPFKLMTPLRRMASYKLIENIWKTQKSKELALYAASNSSGMLSYDSLPKILQYFNDIIDDLIHPTLEEEDPNCVLKSISVQLVSDAISWLCIINERDLKTFNCSQYLRILTDFIEHLTWTNQGCIDTERLLKSYVSTRDRIHLNVWKLLCDFCFEREIMKFAPQIEFHRRIERRYRPSCVYWYWKICRILPHERVMPSRGSSTDLQSLLKEMLHGSLYGYTANTSAVMYCRKKLNNDVKFMEFCLNNPYAEPNPPYFRLLREIKSKRWLASTHATTCMYKLASSWPYMQYTRYWIPLLRNRAIKKEHFNEVFHRMVDNVYKWTLVEWDDMPAEDVWETLLYFPLREHTKVFRRKGMLRQKEDLFIMHTSFFEAKEWRLNKIFFEQADLLSRTEFINHLIFSPKRTYDALKYADFCDGFRDEALITHDEQLLFQTLIDMKRPPE